MPRLASKTRKITKADLARARGKRVTDVIDSDLLILFCGINPGLYSGATGHHFARPGSRFWPALKFAGVIDAEIQPAQELRLLDFGCGITNLVNSATAKASDLSAESLKRGARKLTQKIMKYRPRIAVILGLGAYRLAFSQPMAAIGPQPQKIDKTVIWLLPNPSGANGLYQLNYFVQQLRLIRKSLKKSLRA